MCSTTEHNKTVPNRLEQNYKRVRKMGMQRHKNISYANDMLAYRKEVLIECDAANDNLDRYHGHLLSCCSRAIGQIDANSNNYHVAVKTARFCNDRLCNVCNSIRAKKLRRKFFNFLNSEENNIPIKKKQQHFFPSIDTKEAQLFVSGKQLTENFDFMHLTLTVPHKNGLWNGKSYYAKELLQKFHTMRKCDWWSELVWGGEQCVETVQTDNNLHIHIHSLLLVKKSVMQSRNILTVEIMKKWNELTIDETVKIKSGEENKFSEERRKGLKNSLSCLKPKTWFTNEGGIKVFSENRLSDEEDVFFQSAFENVVEKLDVRGSTMIGLNNLYKEVSTEFYNKSVQKKFMRNGKTYVYVNRKNTKDLLKGVLETLKYHFEPCSLEDDDGKLNVDFLMQLLPNIYRQRLYGKFGGFYGLKQLNVSEEPINENDAEDFLENAQDECYHPTTGNPCPATELLFVVFDLKDLRFNKNELHYTVPPDKIKFRMPGYNMKEAMKDFTTTAVRKRILNTVEFASSMGVELMYSNN